MLNSCKERINSQSWQASQLGNFVCMEIKTKILGELSQYFGQVGVLVFHTDKQDNLLGNITSQQVISNTKSHQTGLTWGARTARPIKQRFTLCQKMLKPGNNYLYVYKNTFQSIGDVAILLLSRGKSFALAYREQILCTGIKQNGPAFIKLQFFNLPLNFTFPISLKLSSALHHLTHANV